MVVSPKKNKNDSLFYEYVMPNIEKHHFTHSLFRKGFKNEPNVGMLVEFGLCLNLALHNFNSNYKNFHFVLNPCMSYSIQSLYKGAFLLAAFVLNLQLKEVQLIFICRKEENDICYDCHEEHSYIDRLFGRIMVNFHSISQGLSESHVPCL